ncbi:DinB family protein [Chitinophaga agrisoli]|uniref:DinB family protein n=1 Tax=Chitinophaga agrisoli TaxID=2607653 RepID=A0A5B2VIZ5_9BACT|nr:DinB family protein [Chitinophaga agrisoli]KAA2238915.1 DinB family protein [Chitinophaga agrisoli]
MQTKQATLRSFETTFTSLLQILSAFNQEQLNTVPFEGSWTAGQLGRHLQKGAITDTLTGPSKPTMRQPDEKMPIIESIFLDFNTKMQSPDFVRPEDMVYDRDRLIHELSQIVARTEAAIQVQDLTLTYTEFDIPGIGEMTRMEWIHFGVCHAQRHIRQLKNIYEHVVGGRA